MEKTIEQMIFERRFPNEDYDANDFNDWAKENDREAYRLCLIIARELLEESKGLANIVNSHNKTT